MGNRLKIIPNMKLRYKPHTPRLKIVDQYIRELFRDELPDGIKYHNADHTLHPTKGVVAVANNIAISENIIHFILPKESLRLPTILQYLRMSLNMIENC
jgi:hypothetical protein